jgi:hypothetical protein
MRKAKRLLEAMYLDEAVVTVPDAEMPKLSKVVQQAIKTGNLPAQAGTWIKLPTGDDSDDESSSELGPAGKSGDSKDKKAKAPPKGKQQQVKEPKPEPDKGEDQEDRDAYRATLEPEWQAKYDQYANGPQGQKALKPSQRNPVGNPNATPKDLSTGPHSTLNKPSQLQQMFPANDFPDLPAPKSAAVSDPAFANKGLDSDEYRSPFHQSARGEDPDDTFGYAAKPQAKPAAAPKLDPRKQFTKDTQLGAPKKQGALSRIFRGRRDDDI